MPIANVSRRSLLFGMVSLALGTRSLRANAQSPEGDQAPPAAGNDVASETSPQAEPVSAEPQSADPAAQTASPKTAAPRPAPVRTQPIANRIVSKSSDARGTTLTLELVSAPFPAPGAGYQDPTVLVFVPKHHRVVDRQVHAVVHFHGHSSTAERATTAHQLREQLFDSKQNAVLIVPQLAFMSADSSCGKLDQPGAFAKMMRDVMNVLCSKEGRAALGVAGPRAGMHFGRVCVSAHSGGYHSAAAVIRTGGMKIQEVFLFDALYSETEVFRDWVIAGKGKAMGARHKLVSYFTAGTTEANTQRLFAELEKAGVVVARETVEGSLSRESLMRAEAVSIRTQLSHGAVASEFNGLRDCLFASALRRRLRTSWFEAKDGARPIDRRSSH